MKALDPILLRGSAGRCFSSVLGLKAYSEMFSKIIRCERDVQRYEWLAVENQVTAIIENFSKSLH